MSDQSIPEEDITQPGNIIQLQLSEYEILERRSRFADARIQDDHFRDQEIRFKDFKLKVGEFESMLIRTKYPSLTSQLDLEMYNYEIAFITPEDFISLASDLLEIDSGDIEINKNSLTTLLDQLENCAVAELQFSDPDHKDIYVKLLLAREEIRNRQEQSDPNPEQ